MATITTAEGKIFEIDKVAVLPSPSYIYIRILNSNEQTIRKVFGNGKETARLYTKGETFYGYTKLGYVMPEGNAWKVRLEKT